MDTVGFWSELDISLTYGCDRYCDLSGLLRQGLVNIGTVHRQEVVGREGCYQGWLIPFGGRAFVRYIGYLVSGIVLSIGFLWVAFDGKRQGWHDKMAGTYVIYVEEEFSASDEVRLVPSDLDQRNWIWLIVWVVVAILVPSALIGSLWLLSPVVHKIIVSLTPF